MSPEAQRPHASLNPYQANRLRITCQYIDKLLGEIEDILNATTSKAAFPRYTADIVAARRRTIEDYIARVRAQLVRILDGQGIARENASIPASRVVHVMLGAIDIAAEELKPKYMRGYGEVPETVATELNGIAGEVSGLIHRFDRYLCEGTGGDLKARLERLEHSGNDLKLLEQIEETVRDRGLVEFRSSITSILDRAEDRSFEIAVFGRVSAGKSSLLNAVLETDVLPVGVTPITAVPTRIIHAEEPSLFVWASDAPKKKLDISRLQEFATEQQNPGNMKHVTRLVVALPSPRLEGGVTFMDTPGLGSLATSGAAETLAYLPKCDLGVFLIDAASTLTPDDLQTIMSLHEAAIPVNVLLSKADLLGAKDRVRIVQYVSEHIASECQLDLPVHPVSVLSSCKEMLDEWFQTQIVPLYARAQNLRAASLRRKIGALRDSVGAALEARLTSAARSSTKSREQARRAEALLRRTTGQIEETHTLCERFIGELRATVPVAVEEAAKQLLDYWSENSDRPVVSGQLARDSITQFVHLQVRKLQTEISTLAAHLGHNLWQSAADLGLPDAPSEGEFQSVIRGSPVFESPAISLRISRPKLALIFGRGIAEHSVSAQISREMRGPLCVALDAYCQVLREWMDSVMGQLKQRFESYAENYRAQAERRLEGREITAEELVGLEGDLTRLKSNMALGRAPREVDWPQQISKTS
ncbi:MAG: dynamin family protein [Candidatus Acidiferrales bacterium]